MSKQIKLKIITPERVVLEEDVDSVTLPTTEGEITILPGHIALITAIRSGDVVATVGGEHIPHAVSGGFIEVKQNVTGGEVAVMADFAEHVSDISDEAIVKAKARAEELSKMKEEVVDFEHFATELQRSLTRVKIAEKWKSKKYRR